MKMDGIKKKISWKDPGRLKEPPKNFHCTEIVEEGDVGTIRFTCTVAPGDKCLVFSCRGRSVGMLVKGEDPAEENDEMEFEKVDGNFFDSGYTLAGMTGFQIWSASRLLIEVLTWPSSSNNNYYNKWQQTIVGAKIIELGSGIGVVGTSLAYAGGHVLLTDLPTLVENAVIPNLLRNATENNTGDDTHWKDAIPIGKGWASALPLDWTKPLSAEKDTMKNIDFIIASDCVWLTSMCHALLDTITAIFEMSPNATCLLSFQQRNTTTTSSNSSSMFTSIDSILETLVVQHGWKVDCIAWRPIYQNDDETEEEIPVFVLEIQQSTNIK